MRRTMLPATVALGALLSLLVVGPASAATTGTLCGQITAFTPATAVADGSLTIDGTTEVIDTSAFGAIDAATITTLTVVANAGATSCLVITANGSGEIVDLDIAAQAEICGAVTLDTATGVYSVAGVALPLSLVSADADLAALLAAAARVGAGLCAEVTVDGTTGLITTVRVNGTLTVCGRATLDADSVTLGGLDIPLSLLDAEARATLQLAIDAGVIVCTTLVVSDTDLVEANLNASVDICGVVTLTAGGNAVVNGVVLDAGLLDAQAEALLELAARADGNACVAADAVSSGGDTRLTVTLTINLCAEVTAITDDSITLGGVTFVFAGAADADIRVGDEVCVAATTVGTGNPVVTDIGDALGAATGGPRALPDTAVPSPAPALVVGALLALASAISLSAARRSQLGRR